MYSDVVDLRQFYDAPLGHIAQRMVRQRLRDVWPDVRGQSVLGVGYATPYLRALHDEAERTVAIMPARQGVVRWPPGQRNLVALAEDAELPFADMTFDRIVLVHALEVTEFWGGLLRECWRVLAGGGRLLVVVPGRRGLWARVDRTPFGHGHPYSAAQLQRLLRDHHFVPEQVARALYVPPFRSRFLIRGAAAWERLGRRWFPRFAGVVMVEASKQLYQRAQTGQVRQRRRVLIPLPSGAVARTATRQERGPLPSG